MSRLSLEQMVGLHWFGRLGFVRKKMSRMHFWKTAVGTVCLIQLVSLLIAVKVSTFCRIQKPQPSASAYFPDPSCLA